MKDWFNGKILCAEVKRYINNFLVVTRARPDDDLAEEHSDDLVIDEELSIDEANVTEAISTRIGSGRHKTSAQATASSLTG